MREFTNAVSNDSVSTIDRESGCTAVTEAQPLGKYHMTRGDIFYFAACCVTLPGWVLFDVVRCVENEDDLRSLVSSNARPPKLQGRELFAVLGVPGAGVGLLVGLGEMASSGASPAVALACTAGGAILSSFGIANLAGAFFALCEGTPPVFRATMRMASASRPVERLRSFTSAPVYKDQPKLQGPK